MPDVVDLQTEVSITDDALSIHYQVKNGHSETIYLVNRPFLWKAEGLSVEPDIIYTYVEDKTLKLSKAYLKPPKNALLESVDVPYLTEVEAGQSFEEAFSLPLPLEPLYPFGHSIRSDSPSTFEKAQLVIGWLPGDKVTVKHFEHPSGLKLISTDYKEAEREQQLLTAALDVSIPAFIKVE